ncbi:ABC transporter substrate-binding protein [Acidovorax sp. CCYZU-2555]|uniref:ABC transporter substrate-binding protein n=1 Tax=Acidovorax sp. CCYZU-2555 TaxID=2835042 RepID=UPI001BD14B14|nr:ABC transporter substrate-binding protein [Acidovorax sp. CCYZU-2555]MBS7777610.1 ABC transporter substrate-binding protein [Acidovorax sp. CCYZU-2555]
MLSRLLRPLSCPVLCLGLAVAPAARANEAAQSAAVAARPFTIVMVLPRAAQSTEAGFRNYLERENVAARYVEVRFSGNKLDEDALRQQVAALRPDLIYAWGTPTSLALAGRHDQSNAANPLRNTPIVFTEVTDPVNAGLIKNLQQPERNVTGVSHVAPLDIQFNAIQAYRPFRKIGYLHNPAEPNSLTILRNLQAQAQRLGLQVIDASLGLNADQTPDPAQIGPLVADIAARGADLLYIGPITFLAFTHREAITQAALRQQLPTFCTTESIVRRSGCLFGLFSNDTNVGRFAGSMARQILLEKKPVSAIAASTLQRFSLLVNIPTAQTLQLYPPMLLLNVAEVIPAPPASPR